jgi:hypothetical protein
MTFALVGLAQACLNFAVLAAAVLADAVLADAVLADAVLADAVLAEAVLAEAVAAAVALSAPRAITEARIAAPRRRRAPGLDPRRVLVVRNLNSLLLCESTGQRNAHRASPGVPGHPDRPWRCAGNATGRSVRD